jgi:hypothetical protein
MPFSGHLAINIRYSGIFFASEASLYVCYMWGPLGLFVAGLGWACLFDWLVGPGPNWS